MPNPIDLCTTADVRAYLSMVSGLPNNSAQTSEVSTTSPAITAGNSVVVTPASMANIFVGMILGVDVGANQELVAVTSATGTTFTASFAKNHSNPVAISDQTNIVIGKLITSASNYWLWATGKQAVDGAGVTTSPFVQVSNCDGWYDGNGNTRLFLRQSPIVSVVSLQINGATIPAAVGFASPGFVIDSSGKCLAFRSSGSGVGLGSRGGWGNYRNSYGCFSNGVQNINVVYTAGYNGVPPDVNDACTEMVAMTFERRRYLDQVQISQANSQGTVSYSKLEMSLRVSSIMDNYSRLAAV